MKISNKLKLYLNAFDVKIFINFMIMITLIYGCSKTTVKKGPVVNVQIYGSYKKKDKCKLVINGETFYDKSLYNPTTYNRRILYYADGKKKLKVFFSINTKDTVFNYDLKKQNYLKLMNTINSQELLVIQADSSRFWHNDKDYL